MPSFKMPGPLARNVTSFPLQVAMPGPIGMNDDNEDAERIKDYCKAGKWVPRGPATGPRGAMIVPDASGLGANDKNKELFDHNGIWASQWEAHDDARRNVFSIKVDGSLADFEAVVDKAIKGAGGQEVILLTGHGGLGSGAKNQTTFDTVPETGGMSTHKHAITQEVLDLDTWAVKDGSGNWVPKPKPDGKPDPDKANKEKDIKRLAPRYDMLTRIGKKMKDATLIRLRLLTCRVGSDIAFVKKLAKVMGIQVIAYTEWTITNDDYDWNIVCPGSNKKIKMTPVYLWNGTASSPPTISGPDDEAYSTVPTNNEVRKSP